MVLKELEIQGFKSFPDKIKIPVNGGITGVVGPNGSGKSNIADAIRWVLGETSSKQLRGAGKMEDVIFGGTQQRGAMGFASVKLTLDNRARIVDMDADDVTISRKYYRSGDSEYAINGQHCRLKDVYELLLDTGLGRDGYSVIGQGRIAEIVGAKSTERREIFEEASGIAKYRYRKNEAERRLLSAEENLERLRDILDELEARVGPLEKESARAQQFLELSARRKSLEVTLWVDGVHRAKETVRDQQRKYETAAADYDRLDQANKAAEAEAEEIRTQAQRLTMDIERLNGDIRSITEEMADSASRIAVLENDIAHNDRSAQELEQEILRGEENRENLHSEIDENQQAIAAITQEIGLLQEEISRAEQTLAQIEQDSLASGERRGAVTAALARMTDQQTACRVQAAAASSAAAAARERLTHAGDEFAANQKNLETQQTDRADTLVYLEKIKADKSRLENISQGIRLKLNTRKQSLAQADETEQRLNREIDAAVQRIQVLRDLEKNMDGYQQSVKSVMHAAEAHRLRGIAGPVSSILSVEKGYEMAIETALGAALQNIVVEGESAAKAAIAFLRDTRGGRATFLPLDTIQPGFFRGSLTGTAQLASELVSCEPRYEKVVQYLLGRIVVVDDINEASVVARSLGYHNKVVTVDGQVVNAGGSFTGGSMARSAGLFTRKQEVRDLKQKVAKLEAQQRKARQETDQWKAQVDSLKAELQATESEIITLGNDIVRAETEATQQKLHLQQVQAAVDMLSAELEALQKQAEENETIAASRQTEDSRLTAEIEKLSGELNTISEGDDSFLQTRSRMADELSEKRLRKLELEKDTEAHRTAIQGLEGRSAETTGRKAELEQNIQLLRQSSQALQGQIETIRSEKAAADTRIQEKEAAIRAASQARLERETAETRASQKARETADERERMSQEMARLAERRTNAEAEYDQTIDKLWDEYQLSVSEAEKLCVAFDNIALLRMQVAELRGKIRNLGHVNVGAVEEYKEVRQRYDTLRAQVEDVEKSKASLTRMIHDLSGEMRTIFSQNFAAINENFGRIFQELFGGGKACLSLEEADDVLEAGIDIQVTPPGKVIKNLAALSGGEQSLVAICIYFAILAVNPAPFCILDEIEAALDDANVVRYAQYLRRISDKTQFIVITHRRGTMEEADVLYGVTMQEDGVSKLLRLDLDSVDASLIS